MDDRREYREQHVPRPRTLLLRILRAATVPSLPAGGKFRFAPRRYLRTTESRGKHPETDGNDPAELPSVPLQRGAAMAQRDGIQLVQPVAAAGAAEKDRQLVANKFAAAAG